MRITLDLPDELYDRLQSAATASGDSELDYVRKVLQAALTPLALAAPLRQKRPSRKLHFTAPIVGLVEGLLFGDTTVAEALQFGNFGLGTLNGLDGEVVILDGQPFQQGADGSSVPVPPSARTPFMCTTAFDKAQATRLELPLRLDWPGLHMALQQEFPSANLFYAILVEGTFEHLRARAVRKQTTGRPLAAVAREQAVFELHGEEGWLVGFWSPPYMGHALTVPGFHLHFLSRDKARGGHVLEGVMLRGSAYIQPVYHAETDLPKSHDYLAADLTRDPAADLEAAEK